MSEFNVYGFRFRLLGSSSWAIDSLERDFAYFWALPDGTEYPIELMEETPVFDNLPYCEASVYTPRNVVYRSHNTSFIDYQGKGLGFHDLVGGGFRIVSADPNLTYEAAYLFLLSQISQFLDKKGMHRIHALALAVNGRALLVLLPMGGGKSTLGSGILAHPAVSLLSDDSAFVDSRGCVHAFPLHLGLCSGMDSKVPENRRRLIRRMEFGPKTLIDYEYFAERVVASAEPGIVFLGRRVLSQDCRICPASFSAGVRAMVANSVVGLGLFHGLEFILERSPLELIRKLDVGCSRLRNCIRLLRRSQIHYLNLGRNSCANAAAVVKFAQENLI